MGVTPKVVAMLGSLAIFKSVYIAQYSKELIFGSRVQFARKKMKERDGLCLLCFPICTLSNQHSHFHTLLELPETHVSKELEGIIKGFKRCKVESA